MLPFRSLASLVAALLLLAACAAEDLSQPVKPIGDFRLGHNIVVAPQPQQGPFSRDATAEELTGALADTIDRRLGRFDGDGLYHLGVHIGAYVLAQPGLPVVYTPRSVLMFEVTVYDNETQEKLNDKPHRITAFEGLENTAPIIGSGLARGKEEQLENLAREGARLIEAWLRENEAWFEPDPDGGRTPFDRDAERARLAVRSGAVSGVGASN
ncbi:hypothetical protein DXV76_17760 [Rhodobacteraceae bacterium CCMM004]|nr:hypothetical protein DXV76_17760 [Rhodobacteraceae bacterium CCMM004]